MSNKMGENEMLKKKMCCKTSTVILLGIITFNYIFQFYTRFLLRDFNFLGIYHVKYQLILQGLILCFCLCVVRYYLLYGKKRKHYIYSSFGLAIFPVAIYYLLVLNNVSQIFVISYFVIVIFVVVCRMLSLGSVLIDRLNCISTIWGIIICVCGTLSAGIVFVKNTQLSVEVKKEEVITIDNIRSFEEKTAKEKQIIAQKIVYKESKLLGIEEPKVYVTELSNKEVAGFTNRTSTNIYISSDIDDVYNFVDTVLHEFFHRVEYELVFNKEKTNDVIKKLVYERIEKYQEEFTYKDIKIHNLQSIEIDADWYSRAHILNY